MSKSREKEIIAALEEKRQFETMRLLNELLCLKYDRIRDNVVSSGCDLMRGRALELKDLLKIFEQ